MVVKGNGQPPANPNVWKPLFGIRCMIRWCNASGLAACACFLGSSVCRAQVSTIYSYNNSNRVIQAIRSTGSGVLCQYNAVRNMVGVIAIGPQQLTSGTPDIITFSALGKAALLSITLTNGQPSY